jgi:L-fuconolactonase
VNRRAFLHLVAGAAGLAAAEKLVPRPIIDTHIHLFDPTRPQGVPWPPKQDTVLYKPALPTRYREIAQRFGIGGAIAIECSPWAEDNDWLLDAAARDTIMVGVVGNLDPAAPEFRRQIDRLRHNRLFRGIRYGNLWGRDLGAQLSNPAFMSGLKALADSDLSLDTANPDPPLIAAVVRLTDHVPTLRVVIDHLPQLDPPSDAPTRDSLRSSLRELGARPQVYVKVSEVLRSVNGRVPTDLGFYRARLDEIWEIFGEDRLMFGSDWPNSDHWGTYAEVFEIVHDYMAGKSAHVKDKFFYGNSLVAYRWISRGQETASG